MIGGVRDSDLIAALATAPGEGGVSIVRMSGEGALRVLKSCFTRRATGPWQSHRLYYGHVTDATGQRLDEAMAVYMRAPKTYTREDVAEIHCHGGQAAPARVLALVLASGARPARPGEFTERAFWAGRIDLSEAEGVMALVSARSEDAARAAMRQMEGGVSRLVRGIADQLTEILALIEAGVDFPEEIEEQANAAQAMRVLDAAYAALDRAADPARARIVREGLSVALVGRPNTGKSSLLNGLAGGERAIVTDTPGTTRDVLSEQIDLGGVRVGLLDTAGQRETSDEIERIGVSRAQAAEKSSDLVLLVLDGSAPLTRADEEMLDRRDERWIALMNKSDLPRRARIPEGITTLSVSARTGMGLDALRDMLRARALAQDAGEHLLVTQRHLALAAQAKAALARAMEGIAEGVPLDLAAIDVQEALEQLLRITGESASEEVVASIFANFCVGK